MFLPKTEVQWKLHQEGDAGIKQCHQHSPAIPEARQDERIHVPHIQIARTPTFVGNQCLPCYWNPEEIKQTGRFQNIFARYRVLLLIAITLLSLLVIGLVRVNAPQSPNLLFLDMGPMQSQQNTTSSQTLMRGKVASLGWIVGKDCQRGIQAYLKTAGYQS